MSQDTSIANCSDDQGFIVNLTSDKLYVNSATSQETFALRSINGVGTYDDIDKFNSDLAAIKFKRENKFFLPYSFIGGGVISILIGIADKIPVVLLIIGLIFIIYGIQLYNVKKAKVDDKPVLDSYFKVMISGNERKFKFNKESINSNAIANLINKIEETLTSYNDS